MYFALFLVTNETVNFDYGLSFEYLTNSLLEYFCLVNDCAFGFDVILQRFHIFIQIITCHVNVATHLGKIHGQLSGKDMPLRKFSKKNLLKLFVITAVLGARHFDWSDQRST
jgi:hypothetical protein